MAGVRFACDSCGFRGREERATTVQELQCPVCGEPVTPWPEDPADTW